MNAADYEEIPEEYEEIPDEPAAPARQVSTAEAAQRGFLQGGTLGFGDELAAAIDAGVSKVPGVRAVVQKLNTLSGGSGAGLPVDDPSITYEQRRDAYRGHNAASQAQHPTAHAAGEITGAVATARAIPGVAGGGLAGAAKGGALAGGAAGVGTSEATDLGGGLFDAGIGALVGAGAGAAFHGAAKALAPGALGRAGAAAEERGIGRALGKLEEKVYPRTRAGLGDSRVDTLVRETPELRKAAGNDSKVAQTIAKAKDRAHAALDEVYGSALPEIDPMDPINAMGERIRALRASKLPSDLKVADKLASLRDGLAESLGKSPTSPKTLRAIQTDYQGVGYARAPLHDVEASANVRAHQEASKAVGDAVVRHITGMDFAAAKEAAALDPRSAKTMAAQLFKANDTINAANRIEAGIADRARRVKPAADVIGKVEHAIKHPVHTALSVVPRGMEAANDLLARAAPKGAPAAPGADEALERFMTAAKGGNGFARRVLETLAATPAGAARIAAMSGREALQP